MSREWRAIVTRQIASLTERLFKQQNEIICLTTEVEQLRTQRSKALAACDRMMAGDLSPSGIVAEVREALGWSSSELINDATPVVTAHGYTRHGHPCCDKATLERPLLVARCGSTKLCTRCRDEAEQIHGGGG